MSDLAESWDSNSPQSDSDEPARANGSEASLEGVKTRALIVAAPATTREASQPVAGPDFGAAAEEPGAEDFELHEEIGRGAMGVVYRATQKSLRREVAVKTVAPGRDSAKALPRFEQEARLTGFLDHPNIIPIYDFGTDAHGRAMLAMKRVEGQSWKERLAARGEEAPGLVDHLRTLIQVCHAVAFAHSRGIAHCDLKPGNVMVGRFGEVLVMDWGIAVGFREDGAARATPRAAVTSPLGTPCYMAPEMARGDGAGLGPHTDIYLLGAILFELLENRPPHTGSNPGQCLTSALESSPPAFLKPAPAELRALCREAMAAEAEDRPASVDAFRERLEGYLSHRESLRIADQAESQSQRGQAALASAWAGREVAGGRDAVYADLTEAIAGFRQARFLWPANRKAAAGELEARLAYAEAALIHGDLGLAEEQARRAEKADGAAELLALIADQQLRRLRAARSSRWLRRFVAAAILTFSVGATLSYFLIRDARLEARRRQVAMDLDLVAALNDENETLWPARAENIEALGAWLERARTLVSRRGQHVADLARARWEQGALTRLIKALDALEDKTIPEVERRLERARALRDRPAPGAALRARWRRLHPDMKIQEGLIPLGPDPRSKLPEFAVEMTGSIPKRGPDGRLAIDDGSAIVLVLLPGGRFLMGAEDTGPGAAIALPREKPARTEEVAPFFMSKYELTQSQWRTITDRNPSGYRPTSDYGKRMGVTLRHPVETVPWQQAQTALQSMGLELPTEAQWEYACRAGTRTIWWWGDTREAVERCENISDRAHHEANAQHPCEVEFDDGFKVHAPVGSLLPNPFGLHDMGGNVQEWCADPYPNAKRPEHVFRGSAWSRLSDDARSSARFHHRSTYRSISLGFRPIRRLQ